jgi:flagellar basal-body rod modification protein FlgD
MNALVSFRGNSVGSLSSTSLQRQDAMKTMTSNFRARVDGLMRRAKAQATPGVEKSASQEAVDYTASRSEGNQELDRDAFLQLLVMEMQNQDPLEPMDNSEMVSQLAQFSALEQMNTMAEGFTALQGSMDTLTGNMDQLNFISAQSLLGQQVEGISAGGSLISGTVDSVHLNGSIVLLSLGEETMPMTGVISIGEQRVTGSEAGA